MHGTIPIVDFAQAVDAPDAAARELLQACADWGFFYVKNHPIPQDQVDEIFALEKAFFAQAEDVKSQAPYDPSKNAGFKGLRSVAPTKRPDPREAFSLNKFVDEAAAEAFPLSPGLDTHRMQLLSFQKSLHAFASSLLELIATALSLPPSTFTSQHPRLRPNFDNFELMHYPPLLSERSSEEVAYRISPHTDWGTVTLLFQQSVGGLQVRPPRYTSSELQPDEQWTSAPVYNDMVLINIGDMLEFWTAGKLKSTFHRVVPTPETRDLDRYCFAYFLHPDKDAILEPIKGLEKADWTPRYAGKGRTAEQHIRARIASTVHGSSTLVTERINTDEAVQEIASSA